MLYTRLRDLYNKNKVLNEEYSFDQYYPLLENFISKEVNLGAEYLSPYRFALSFSKPPKDAIRFFLGLADSEDILIQQYKYECDSCGKINIIKDEEALVNFTCRSCGFKDHLATSDHLSEVKLLFKLDEELLAGIEESLKNNPLSNVPETFSAVLEGGIDIDEEVTLKSAEELVYKDGKPIGEKAAEKFKKYRDIL